MLAGAAAHADNWVAPHRLYEQTYVMVGLFVLVILVAMGIASALGYTADTRDPEYSLGRVCEPRTAPDGQSR